MLGKELSIPKCIKEDTQLNVKEMDSLLKFSLEVIAPLDGFHLDCEEVEKAYIKLCNDEDLVNIIPENIIGTARGYNFLVNKLKDFRGYENVKRDRVSNGSSYQKKYVIKGIAFIDENNYSPFDDEEQQSFLYMFKFILYYSIYYIFKIFTVHYLAPLFLNFFKPFQLGSIPLSKHEII